MWKGSGGDDDEDDDEEGGGGGADPAQETLPTADRGDGVGDDEIPENGAIEDAATAASPDTVGEGGEIGSDTDGDVGGGPSDSDEFPEYNSDDPEWVDVSSVTDVEEGDVVVLRDTDSSEQIRAVTNGTGMGTGSFEVIEDGGGVERGDEVSIDTFSIGEEHSLSAKYVEGRGASDADGDEGGEQMSEEERAEFFRERMEQLPAIPDPPTGRGSGRGVDVDSNDFSGGKSMEGVDEAIKTLSEGELLGVGVEMGKPSSDEDYGPFKQESGIPIYDGASSEYPYVDITMDTENFANVEASIHEEYFGSTREKHFGSAEIDDVEEYADVMESEGTDGEFPLPQIVLNENGEVTEHQEGRHRALAALAAGVEQIPVRVIVRSE